MKVVLLHDWLTGFRGGERVLDAFCEIFPDAPIYTLLYIPGRASPRIENRKIHSSFLNKIPGIEKNYRKFLPLFPRAAKSLHILECTDLVLSSSHCVIKGVQKPLTSKHICYLHSPMRYLYDQYDAYFGPQSPLAYRLGMRMFKDYLTNWDINSNSNVDSMIANSHFVAQRIERLYHRQSTVIHPFVDLEDFRLIQSAPPQKENFDLIVSAFAPNKHLELAIKTFNQLKRPLKIIGSGQLESDLREAAGPTIEFLGNVDRKTVIEHLFKARSLIFPGVEDFGITPLEALAAGTPVIALAKGGVLESLTEKTAIFFNDLSTSSLSEALSRRDQQTFDRQTLYNRAASFSRQKFINNISNFIDLEMSSRIKKNTLSAERFSHEKN